MTPDIEKIEHLLNAKTFAQLTASERELVLAHLSGADEYEHMRETLLRVKKIFTAEAAAVASDADLKEQILNRFEQSRPRSASLWQRMAVFFETLVPSPAARFAGAMALLLAVVSAGFFMWPGQRPEMAQQQPPVIPHAPAGPVIPEAAENLAESADGTEVQTATHSSRTAEKTSLNSISEEWAAGSVAPAPITVDTKVDRPVEPPTYTNSEGYVQYSNVRVAESISYKKESSDAYKDYRSQNNRAAKEEAKEISRIPEESRVVTTDVKAQKQGVDPNNQKLSQATLRPGDSGSRADGSADDRATGAAVWPGTETHDRHEALKLTDEKLRTFFSEETKAAYRPAKEKRYVRLTLTFNETGGVTRAEVSGNLTAAQQKAFEEKALGLPAFHLPQGTPTPREETYYLPLHK